MCLATAPLFAQNDMSQPPKPAAPGAKQPAATPPGTPSQDDMMKMMEQMGKTGPNHQLLNGMVGEWTCDCKFWMDPTNPSPTTSKGTATNTWVMDKKFVKQEFKGTFAMAPGAPEAPFNGMGYTGYDNVKGKFVSTWMDSMSTGIMYSEGSYDAASKTFTFSAQCTDPMTNKPTTVTEVIKVIDDNTHTFTMSGTGPDGKDMKMGEITYHRKGGKPADSMEKPMSDKPAGIKPATPAPAPKPGRGNNPGGG